MDAATSCSVYKLYYTYNLPAMPASTVNHAKFLSMAASVSPETFIRKDAGIEKQ
jgi:hypothetical protein